MTSLKRAVAIASTAIAGAALTLASPAYANSADMSAPVETVASAPAVRMANCSHQKGPGINYTTAFCSADGTVSQFRAVAYCETQAHATEVRFSNWTPDGQTAWAYCSPGFYPWSSGVQYIPA